MFSKFGQIKKKLLKNLFYFIKYFQNFVKFFFNFVKFKKKVGIQIFFSFSNVVFKISLKCFQNLVTLKEIW